MAIGEGGEGTNLFSECGLKALEPVFNVSMHRIGSITWEVL